MSFYINDFRKHLQGLSDKVEHPYDEPAQRQKNYGSIEEAYQTMKQPRGFQRPTPVQLNEAPVGWPPIHSMKNSRTGWRDATGLWHWDKEGMPQGGQQRSAGRRGISNRGRKWKEPVMAPPLYGPRKNTLSTSARWMGNPNLGGGGHGGGIG